MASIRPIDAIASKWANVTPQRTQDYADGVATPRKDWERATVAAKQGWQDGIQKAIQGDRFAKGVSAAGTQKWQQGATTKGVQRWGPGVQLGQDAYRQGFAPFRDAIERTTLPPRFARRDPRNIERTRVIAAALSKVKEAQK